MRDNLVTGGDTISHFTISGAKILRGQTPRICTKYRFLFPQKLKRLFGSKYSEQLRSPHRVHYVSAHRGPQLSFASAKLQLFSDRRKKKSKIFGSDGDLCVGCVSVVSRSLLGGAGKGMVTNERLNEHQKRRAGARLVGTIRKYRMVAI